jgi:hypothetical protein
MVVTTTTTHLQRPGKVNKRALNIAVYSADVAQRATAAAAAAVFALQKTAQAHRRRDNVSVAEMRSRITRAVVVTIIIIATTAIIIASSSTRAKLIAAHACSRPLAAAALACRRRTRGCGGRARVARAQRLRAIAAAAAATAAAFF